MKQGMMYIGGESNVQIRATHPINFIMEEAIDVQHIRTK